ncbi:hypothetical protein [Sphingomonas soli]|uniref:hypothetical protein n=1 Tax=Sphingomonas soli TaxID=266127 RepID=UPI000835B568|nr:hypothetical protein [Sphingomonas soli]
MHGKTAKLLTITGALLFASTANADEKSAWAKYEARVDGILLAIHQGWETGEASEGRRQRVKELCKGVTRDSTGGQGYVLPTWARSLITACGYVDELGGANPDTIWSSRDAKINCKQMQEDAKAMLKAKPVKVAPSVEEKTRHLGTDLLFFYEGGCKGKKTARNAYHLVG